MLIKSEEACQQLYNDTRQTLPNLKNTDTKITLTETYLIFTIFGIVFVGCSYVFLFVRRRYYRDAVSLRHNYNSVLGIYTYFVFLGYVRYSFWSW